MTKLDDIFAEPHCHGKTFLWPHLMEISTEKSCILSRGQPHLEGWCREWIVTKFQGKLATFLYIIFMVNVKLQKCCVEKLSFEVLGSHIWALNFEVVLPKGNTSHNETSIFSEHPYLWLTKLKYRNKEATNMSRKPLDQFIIFMVKVKLQKCCVEILSFEVLGSQIWSLNFEVVLETLVIMRQVYLVSTPICG